MKEIKQLLKAYGYEESSFYKEENKFRFVSEDDFVDIWFGKKGITIGVYNPETQKMFFKRKVNILQIEEIISQTNV